MAEETIYYGLESKYAELEAEKYGGQVVYPTQYELQLDLDSEEAVEGFRSRLRWLEKIIPVKQFGIGPSRSPGKFHAVVELEKPVSSDMERILLQACLGSDPIRELLSYRRVLERDPHPTLFIEGGTKPKKESEKKP